MRRTLLGRAPAGSFLHPCDFRSDGQPCPGGRLDFHLCTQLDDAIAAYQSIQAKNARLTTVNLVLASLYREKAEQEKNPAAKQALLNRAADADN